jgi:hypothetical protein
MAPTVVSLQLTITDTHITLKRAESEEVLASALLDVLRTDPSARAAWRNLCGYALEAAMTLQAAKTPAIEAGKPVHGLPHL